MADKLRGKTRQPYFAVSGLSIILASLIFIAVLAIHNFRIGIPILVVCQVNFH